eukprot:gnl/Dysnectes_brevis/2099_a2434_1863.p1 GENE.gnl/Dysnectes_brevis/2099_a2434_1863~~gnl/Dysnectes_brevis/2099_a2434_1863.p1  ORF type:complete len:1140 (+),score=373.36 gnl/Dysnectes_brevis/2099_a2434_1863:54-3422(+)
MSEILVEQSNKFHKAKSKTKGKKAIEKKKGRERDPSHINHKAFTVSSAGRMRRMIQMKANKMQKLATTSIIARTGDFPPPDMIAVVGPSGVGKSTVIRELVRHFTKSRIPNPVGPVTIVTGKKRRATFFEVPNDLPSMLDIAKLADLVILVVDAKFGFEMETFEFLNILQTQGFPKVMGVLTHLDKFEKVKSLRKEKRRMKLRFWKEIYPGAKLFFLSGLISGHYPKMEIHNLARCIAQTRYHPMRWRSEHACVLVDRVEKLDPSQSPPSSSDTTSYSMFGWVRGTYMDPGAKVHIPGVGDLDMTSVTAVDDPCACPAQKAFAEAKLGAAPVKRSLSNRDKLLYAPMSDVGELLYDEDAVYVRLGHRREYTGADGLALADTEQDDRGKGRGARKHEGRDLVRELQGITGDGDGSEDEDEDGLALFAGGPQVTITGLGDEESASEEDEGDGIDGSGIADWLRAAEGGDDEDEEASFVESSSNFDLPSDAALPSDVQDSADGDRILADDVPTAPSFSLFVDPSRDLENAIYSTHKSKAANGAGAGDSSLPAKTSGRSDGKLDLFADADDMMDAMDIADPLADIDALFRAKTTGASTSMTFDPISSISFDYSPICTGSDVTKVVHNTADTSSGSMLLPEPDFDALKRCFVTGDWDSAEALNDALHDEDNAKALPDDDDVDEDEDMSSTDPDADNSDDIDPQFDTEAADTRLAAATERVNRAREFRGGRFAPGDYVRIEFNSIPSEFSDNYIKTHPLVIGALLPSELQWGYVVAKMKRHRWHPRVLKTQNPLIFSVGWRRFQSIPVYSMEQPGSMDERMLKYTPEHMHCHATFWGPAAPPASGVMAFATVKNEQKSFRVSATGSVLELSKTSKVVKKLKLVGHPYKIQRNTVFLRDMFSSRLEATAFVGAALKTVSGIRGTIKKALREPEGHVRATFEDRLKPSDIVFFRSWYPVKVQRFFNPVANHLLDMHQWTGVRSFAQLRHDQQVAIPVNPDSVYRPVSRPETEFGKIKVPRSLQRKLPFSAKPKDTLGKRKDRKRDSYMASLVRDDEQKRLSTLEADLRTVERERSDKRRVKARKKREQSAADRVRHEAEYRARTKDARKKRAREIGFAEARAAKKRTMMN